MTINKLLSSSSSTLILIIVLVWLKFANCLVTISYTQVNGVVTFKNTSSPYIIENNLIIPRYSKLIIEPGVEVRFTKGKQLIVHGILEAKGFENSRIKFTKNSDSKYLPKWLDKNDSNNKFRLVEGDSIQDGKLQIFYNNKWRFVCSNHYNWSEADANVTCKTLGYSNGTFSYYSPANNFTHNMRVYLPRCKGSENNLFDCPGASNPELGLTVCDNTNIVSLLCEGFNRENEETIDNWGGIVFEKYAPYHKITQFSSVFYNITRSILYNVDISYAGFVYNSYRNKYYPSSAITVFQYSPLMNYIRIEYSAGNGLNYSNIEAPAILQNSIIQYNKGHGIFAMTRFGNVTLNNVNSQHNYGDGLKYYFNNSVWTQQEQEEYFDIRYNEFCHSQSPLTFPTYYRFKNPNYVRECSKIFSTDSDLRITLHFQKVILKSQYVRYWLEVYDGQTASDLNLIANFTFQGNQTPESIVSRSNYLLVKIKFTCMFNQLTQAQQLQQAQGIIGQFQQQQQQQQLSGNLGGFINSNDDLNQLNALNLMPSDLNAYRSRLFCPNSSIDDEITMFAIIANVKHPDLVVKNSLFANNSLNGINATNIRSQIQLNYTHLADNMHLSGLHVHGGAGDVLLYQCRVENNYLNGINITYSGGYKAFNYTLIKNNGAYGLYIDYDVQQERKNIFQNTTINGSHIELNTLTGVWLGSYCNWSNITINATMFIYNRQDGLVINSCKSDSSREQWYTNITRLNETAIYTTINISWNTFHSNRLNGFKIDSIQNMIGIITNNTFRLHKKGAFKISANKSKQDDALIRNVSLLICYNYFYNNSGRYAVSLELNELNQNQFINFTYNRLENNYMYEAYKELNSRTSTSAVLLVSSSNIKVNFNYFNNTMSKIQIGTTLDNLTSIINASHNWFNLFQPLYNLNYLFSERDMCNSKWYLIRERIFDFSNRSNLAQIIYWPFSCNEWSNWYEASTYLTPPNTFSFRLVNDFGGIYDMGEAVLPENRYLVTHDLVIRPSSKLTIRSGTELNFLNGVGILVQGELVIDGYVDSNVLFKCADQRLYRLYSQHPQVLLEEQLKQEEIRRKQDEYRLQQQQQRNRVNNINETITTSTIASPSHNYINQTHLVFNLRQSMSQFIDSYALRLIDGQSVYDGRLEVTINGRTGTVCNRGWTILNSAIACQQMGLIVDPTIYLYSKWSPEERLRTISKPILMSEVQCDSLDTNLFECRYTNEQDHTCTHQDDVWIRCLQPSWAGIRFSLTARSSRLKYATFTRAGQYDYSKYQLSPAVQIDFNQHFISNLTFFNNIYNSIEILLNQPFRQSILYNLVFSNNNSSGLMLRSSFISIQNLYSFNQTYTAIEYNAHYSQYLLESMRLNMQPYRGTDVKRELTRLKDNIWHIGNEAIVYLYTDTEFNYGPRELNIKIETNNDRVLVVDLIDYNPDFTQEKVVFCEKLCNISSPFDKTARKWNISLPSHSIYFPINTSFSVLHINYNISSLKSGRLAFVVYSVKAPERVYDYRNPGGFTIRNIMPDNVLSIINSTFYSNRHSIVYRHYDDTEDIFGNLRKRAFNLTIHVSNSTFDSNRDDLLVSELGYQINDLVPSVKLGPFGRVNVTFDNCLFKENYGGIRSLYRYHEYSNTIWHFEVKNNRFIENKHNCMKIFLPRLYRFAIKNEWENTTHTMTIRNNEFSANRHFEFDIDGYYAQINITSNTFVDNMCKIGLVHFSGTEKDFYIYNNRIERNEAYYIFELDARSLADNDLDIESLFVDNYIEQNRKPTSVVNQRINNLDSSLTRIAAPLLVRNSPSSYTVALRGVQNCTFKRNVFENSLFDYEFIGGVISNTLNTTIDATLNWWGTTNSTLAKLRIFDVHEWNNHAFVNFIPYRVEKYDFQYSRSIVKYSIQHSANVLGGIIERNIELGSNSVPYQVRADLTIMPGFTLTIQAGVEIEFYPNVGILVLGDLKALGTETKPIRMRPIRVNNNRMPYYSVSSPYTATNVNPHIDNQFNNFDPSDTFHMNATKKLRLFEGLNENEGFLQVYNTTLRAWTMVCDRQFTLQSAQVACKQLNKEYRNALVKSLSYYMAPQYQLPVWNQTFICKGSENNLGECDNFANYHMLECIRQEAYTYVICGKYNLDKEYEPWGGIRFAQPYFESRYSSLTLQEQQQLSQQDASIMNYVEIYGAGRLHDEPNPAIQLIYRSPQITNCIINQSSYHGVEFIQPKASLTLNNLKIYNSLGYGINSLLLNPQTSDQKSSYVLLKTNTMSSQSAYGMIDMCDPHKHYNIEQRVLIFYKYSNLAKDCVKIFRNRYATTATGQLALRFMQLNLVNNTVQNDTIEIYNGTLFNQKYLLATLTNGSTEFDFQRFYISTTDTLSIYLKASVGRENYGFIAEVLTYPSSQYLSPDSFIEISDSEIKSNQLGSLNFVSAGERNQKFYILRNRFISNGIQVFNTSTPSTVDAYLQNTPEFYFGNNYLSHNYGGVKLTLHSGSGVLITRSSVFNNLFYMNRNDTILLCKGELQLPYNELNIYRNLFLENDSPRTDIVMVSKLVSEFTRNQLIENKGMHILETQGFENITSPRNQEITHNLLRDNYAYGMINELEHVNRFRSTMVATSAKQLYFGNYLFNRENDFELTALIDPFANIYGANSIGINSINATNNYWGTHIDAEMRARIRDKYDNASLFEVIYSPAAQDEFTLRDGKCEVGWTLIDDICYIYIGSYNTYKEAERTCKSLEARLARETVAPIRIPRFRQLARNNQFNFESTTYRKLWLHTDNTLSGTCMIMDDYITASILYADCAKQLYPFICEKDPVFLGAKFIMKDEIAFAIGSAGVLLLIIIGLSLLWFYKSRKRKKEHLQRQDTLRRSARANRNILNYTSSSNGITKSTATLNRELSDENVSKNDNARNTSLRSKISHNNKYTNKDQQIKQNQSQKIYSDLDESNEYKIVAPVQTNERKKIFTNRFKNRQQIETNNLNSDNDYCIYDTNEIDVGEYNTEEGDVSFNANNMIITSHGNGRQSNRYLKNDDSPTNGSIKTTETYYTDTLVRMNDKQRIETTVAKNNMTTSTLKSTSPAQQQQQPQQLTPGILKKSFGSTYDHLVNDDATLKSPSNIRANSAYYPPSDEFTDYDGTSYDYYKSKSNRNLNISTFNPLNKSSHNIQNASQQYDRAYIMQNNINYDESSEKNSSSYGNLVNTTSNTSPSHTSTAPRSRLTAPNRPPPALPHKLINETNSPIILPKELSPNSRSVSKYVLAAEAELEAERNYEANKIKDYNDALKQMQVITTTNPSTSSVTMKKPQILSEINKSPLLKNLNQVNSNNYKVTNETNIQHNSSSDIARPPPMETEI